MRESFSGSYLLSISTVFIVLFAGFLAVSINYSRAFTVKNEIVSIIENAQGWRASSGSNASCSDEATSSECQILQYLARAGYNINSTESSPVYCPDIYNDQYGNRAYANQGGYCIKFVCTKEGTGRNSYSDNTGSGYYVITSFVRIELPIIWTGINVPVTGQTMTLYHNNGTLDCSNNSYR